MSHFVQKYPENTFNWIDLSTSDVGAAKQFYTQLFGWEAEDQPLPQGGTYTMLRMNGKSVAGLGQLPPDQLASGHEAYWSSYVSVADTDAMTDKAAALGATIIMPAMTVMDEGRVSVINDPTGAYIGLWQPKNHIGAQLVNIPNTLVWNELATHKLDAAKSFYCDLFGWSFHSDEQYAMFKNGERWAGGLVHMPEYMPEGTIPHWGVYILVDDVAQTVAKALSLGGATILDNTKVSETGTMAVIRDGQGGAFSIMKMDAVDPMP